MLIRIQLAHAADKQDEETADVSTRVSSTYLRLLL